MNEFIIVFVTCKDHKEANKITKSLLNKKLCACVNIVPKIESHYWWQGKIEKSSEVLLIIKTRSSLFKKLSSQIKLNHSYEVPEIISFSISEGNPDYLQWITDSTAHQ